MNLDINLIEYLKVQNELIKSKQNTKRLKLKLHKLMKYASFIVKSQETQKLDLPFSEEHFEEFGLPCELKIKQVKKKQGYSKLYFTNVLIEHLSHLYPNQPSEYITDLSHEIASALVNSRSVVEIKETLIRKNKKRKRIK
jgi:hypothetical protein